MQIKLTEPQFELVTTKEQFPAMVAGFGAGKTKALITRALHLKSNYPNQNVAYYLPTFDLVRNIGFPRFSEELDKFGASYKLNKVFHTIDIHNGGSIIFRSMDMPERIVGYEVADSLVDELDTLKTEQARLAWQKIISRNRQKKDDGSLNTVAVGTTPEGFRFTYEQWGKEKKQGYHLIKASTYSNSRNLPDGYIDSLRNTYPSNLLSAYLDGEFVNLTAGSVYPAFDRTLNATSETIKDKEPLHIGLDFNVTNMSAVIHVLRNDAPHAVLELTGIFDTPAMARLIKERYKDIGHQIFIYPDASGSSRKSNNASESDIAILKQHGFSVLVNSTNPAVKDRVLSVNRKLEDRTYKVNPDTCPSLVESLERQAYDKNGEPDKSSGFDHVIDAAGYFITYRYPIKSNRIIRPTITGF
jgi:phage terminase large subunit